MATGGLVKSFQKYAIERKRLTVDYSCWLEETEVLTNFTIVMSPSTVDAPLTAFGAYSDPTKKMLTMYIGGGKAGQSYRVGLVTETNQGQIKRDDVGMKVV